VYPGQGAQTLRTRLNTIKANHSHPVLHPADLPDDLRAMLQQQAPDPAFLMHAYVRVRPLAKWLLTAPLRVHAFGW